MLSENEYSTNSGYGSQSSRRKHHSKGRKSGKNAGMTDSQSQKSVKDSSKQVEEVYMEEEIEIQTPIHRLGKVGDQQDDQDIPQQEETNQPVPETKKTVTKKSCNFVYRPGMLFNRKIIME